MKHTKSKLISSIVVLVVCFAMLIGSTFAWFTDSASTGVNKIQAGNLDVQLLMYNGSEYVDISNNTEPIFGSDSSSVAQNINKDTLWEPGKTQVAYLAIKNNGNLKLKYKVQLDVANQDEKNMSSAMLYAITPDATNTNLVSSWTSGLSVVEGSQFVSEDVTLEVGATHYFALSIHMKEEAGNEYKGGRVDFDLTVLATQQTGEYDSFRNDYDADADYPFIVFRESVPVEVNGTNNTVATAKTIESIKKADDNVTPLAVVTIPEGAALEDDTTQVEVTIEEVETPSTFVVSAANDVTTYEVDVKGINKDANTALFTVKLNVGKNLNNFTLYHNGLAMHNKDSIGDVAGDQDYYYDSSNGTVTMLTKSFSPFTGTYDKEFWVDHAAESYSTTVDTDNKIITITNAKELALFAKEVTGTTNYSNYIVNIIADIDLGDYIWKPINAQGRMTNITINGNNHSINNMVAIGMTNPSGYGTGFIGNTSGTITINNITFDNAFVSFYKDASYRGNVGGVVMGYTYGTTEFNNVNVINSEIHGFGKIGAILGMGADPGVKVTFNNCSTINNDLCGVYDVGGLSGLILRDNGIDYTKINNCIVNNRFVKSSGESYIELDNDANFSSNDLNSGEITSKHIQGTYWISGNYYYGGYADYYVSYGSSLYDPPISGLNNKYVANSEICINK